MYPNNNIDSKKVKLIKIGLVFVFILIAFAISLSGLLINSVLSPILVGIIPISFIILFLVLKKPVLVLFLTIFVILLPTELIPVELQSLLNRYITIICFGAWFLNIIIHRRKIFISTPTILLIVFIGWAGLTLIWVDNFDAGIVTVQVYIFRLILFMVLALNLIKTKKDLDGLMKVLALNGILLVVISIITVGKGGYIQGSRFQILNFNENALGISLLVTLAAIIWIANNSQKREIFKYFSIIFILISIVLIGLSGSRGSAISLGITIFSLLIWRNTRFFGVASIIIFTLVILLLPMVFSTTLQRFLGSPGESILGGREVIWPAGWRMISDHILFGVGIGNSPYKVLPYIYSSELGDISLHNPLLVIWAETGLIGLLLYLSVLISSFLSFLSQFFKANQTENDNLQIYFPIIMSIFFGYMASWIKGGGLERDFTYFLVLVLLLVPTCLNNEKKQTEKEHDQIL